MDAVRETREQTTIVIELAPFLMRFAASEENEGLAFTRYLLQCLQELVTNLALPTEVSLKIRGGEDEYVFAMTSYQILVNNSRCRLALPTFIPHDVSALELARSVARVIYDNRELWVTSSLAEQVLQQWLFEQSVGDVSATGLHLKEFHAFLIELVHHCFSIDRGKDVVRVLQTKERDIWLVESMFEDTVSSWEATGIGFFLSSTLHDALLSSGASAETPPGTNNTGEKAMPETNNGYLESYFNSLQDAYQRELGIIIPKVKVHVGESLEPNEFRIQLNDLWFPSIYGLEKDQFLVGGKVNDLAAINVAADGIINPLTGSEAALIQGEENAETCRGAYFNSWTSWEVIQQCMIDYITGNIGAFLVVDAVKYNLDMLRDIYPALVDSVLHRLDIVTLTRTFRNLLDEKLSIRDFRPLLEALLAVSGTTTIDLSQYRVIPAVAVNLCPVTEEKKVEEVDPFEYADYLRMVFKRYVSYKHTVGDSILYAYQLDKRIGRRIVDTSQPLNDGEYRQLVKVIFDETQSKKALSADPVILTEYAFRRRVRSVIGKEYPWLSVMCYEELSPYIDLKILGQISWD